ncbi:helix-turn-helix domain-containing protein [Pontiella sp.]|uniref:helix-turn-helix domain-containing protein n=1 Tax=Pontiella sp. TaxID=2837462 RepID=UPI0035680D2D
MICDHFFHRSLQTMPRRFDGMHALDAGYFPHKHERLDRAVDTFNYSVILSGSGTYACRGQKLSVEAPCVITQFPGIRTAYGPHPGTTWEEFYLILPPEKLEWAEAKGLIGENRYLWPIRNLPAVTRALRELLPLLEIPDQRPGKSDRIDFLGERVIMETLLPGEEQPDPASEAATALARAMTAAPGRTYDVRELAADFGVSFSTFRRRWAERFDVPPGQYLQNLRIAECCRLMTETDLKIMEIAERVGIEDPAYFSRLFKQRIGIAPSEYRANRRG